MATRREQQRRLGRGLSTLISAAPTSARDDDASFSCDLELITPMEGQPRRRFDQQALDELSASIAASGVLQPLVVRDAGNGRYTLIAGERRWRASKQAGLDRVPVVVRDVTDDEAFALALVENLQREDLNPVEEALAYQRLIDDFGYTQEEVGKQLGRARTTVTNALRLLRLAPVVQELVADGSLSAGHARAILAAPEPLQAALAERIITEGWSVRRAEKAAKLAKESGALEPPAKPTPRPPISAQLEHVQRQLMERVGARVTIHRKAKGGGTVEIAYADDDGLQSIVDAILDD